MTKCELFPCGNNILGLCRKSEEAFIQRDGSCSVEDIPAQDYDEILDNEKVWDAEQEATEAKEEVATIEARIAGFIKDLKASLIFKHDTLDYLIEDLNHIIDQY